MKKLFFLAAALTTMTASAQFGAPRQNPTVPSVTANGQYLLGKMYENGKGVEQNYSEAIKWYGKAAKNGHTDAQSAEIACQKKEKVIPIELALNLSKKGYNSKNSIIKILEEYGYNYYGYFKISEKFDGGEELWSSKKELYVKNVKLKKAQATEGTRVMTTYAPVQPTGSSASIWKNGNKWYASITIYSEKDFLEWENQLKKLGYKEETYGWTSMGAHGHLFKSFSNRNGDNIEFIGDEPGRVYGYSFY